MSLAWDMITFARFLAKEAPSEFSAFRGLVWINPLYAWYRRRVVFGPLALFAAASKRTVAEMLEMVIVPSQQFDSEEGRIARSSTAVSLQHPQGYAIPHTINYLAERTIPRSSAPRSFILA